MQFKVGEKAVYPSHGVAVITKIESQMIGGSKQDFYILQILSSGAILKIPTTDCTRVRQLISSKEVENVYSILREPGKISKTTWTRRLRQFNDKLRTGAVSDVAEVLRDLWFLKGDKDLSFCEKDMIKKARALIVEEISAAKGADTFQVEQEIDRLLLPN